MGLLSESLFHLASRSIEYIGSFDPPPFDSETIKLSSPTMKRGLLHFGENICHIDITVQSLVHHSMTLSLARIKNLKTLKFHSKLETGLPKIPLLSLPKDHGLTYISVHNIEITNLKFNESNCNLLTHFEYHVQDHDLSQLEYPPSLRSLSLMTGPKTFSNEAFYSTLAKLTNLTSLELYGYLDNTFELGKGGSAIFNQLKDLKLVHLGLDFIACFTSNEVATGFKNATPIVWPWKDTLRSFALQLRAQFPGAEATEMRRRAAQLIYQGIPPITKLRHFDRQLQGQVQLFSDIFVGYFPKTLVELTLDGWDSNGGPLKTLTMLEVLNTTSYAGTRIDSFPDSLIEWNYTVHSRGQPDLDVPNRIRRLRVQNLNTICQFPDTSATWMDQQLGRSWTMRVVDLSESCIFLDESSLRWLANKIPTIILPNLAKVVDYYYSWKEYTKRKADRKRSDVKTGVGAAVLAPIVIPLGAAATVAAIAVAIPIVIPVAVFMAITD